MSTCRWRAAVWEIILIAGSIPFFRSVWMICDSIEFMNRRTGLLLSLAAGLLICAVALLALNRTDKKP